MTAQQSTNNKLIINPEFKRQLLLLQNSANDELNIHISLEKMVHDKHYRLTVLSELDGLGSDALTQLVIQLKHTSVNTKLAVLEQEPQRPKSNEKKSSLALILTSILLMIVVLLGFVSWHNGYLRFAVNYSSLNAPSTENHVELQSGVNPPINPVTPLKTLILPSAERTVKLRLHGSNTVGEQLAPALLEAYLAAQSVTQMQWIPSESPAERELQYVQDGKAYAIELHAHGSSTAFKELLSGAADMGMSSRKIKTSEIESLKATMGDLSISGKEYIIGLDGLAIIVNKSNPIEHITKGMLAKIFSGEINNWLQIGGKDLAINLYARNKNSGTWDTFESLVLKANNKQLDARSHRLESSSELSHQVAQDIAGIGFIGLPYVHNNKALAISETQDSVVLYPTRFTVSTEDYALARRLYMYAPNSANKMAQSFSQFVVSSEGQRVVEQVGLVSQNIKLEETYSVANAPQIYNEYAEIASRLSVNFHFKNSDNGDDLAAWGEAEFDTEFDNKAKRDITRLVNYLMQHRGRRVVLMGFSDSLGSTKQNLLSSVMRARKLEKELNAYGLNITAVEGFGEKLPIASNNHAQGRSKNRRVEVWVF